MPDNRPRAREKHVTGPGAGVHRRGEGQGTGPVGSGSAFGGDSGGSGSSGRRRRQSRRTAGRRRRLRHGPDSGVPDSGIPDPDCADPVRRRGSFRPAGRLRRFFRRQHFRRIFRKQLPQQLRRIRRLWQPLRHVREHRKFLHRVVRQFQRRDPEPERVPEGESPLCDSEGERE